MSFGVSNELSPWHAHVSALACATRLTRSSSEQLPTNNLPVLHINHSKQLGVISLHSKAAIQPGNYREGEKGYLDKANVRGALTEAATAHVEVVLADQPTSGLAHAAVTRVLAVGAGVGVREVSHGCKLQHDTISIASVSASSGLKAFSMGTQDSQARDLVEAMEKPVTVIEQ